MVLAALAHGEGALAFAAPELRADRDFVANAVTAHGASPSHASAELRADADIMLAAVDRCGLAVLQHAAEDLRASACAAASVLWTSLCSGQKPFNCTM